MLRNPICPAPCAPKRKKCIPCGDIIRKDEQQGPIQLLEPNFPDTAVKWNRTTCPPCKGVYTWISSPRAMYNNRKMIAIPVST